MTTFEVHDMTCGHCESTITKAVRALDPAATVRIDLPSHRVEIASENIDNAALSRAIFDAGYTPVAANAKQGTPSPAIKAAGGCCCG